MAHLAIVAGDGGFDLGDQLARQGLAQEGLEATGDVRLRGGGAQAVDSADRHPGDRGRMDGFGRPQQDDGAQGGTDRCGVLLARHGVRRHQGRGLALRRLRQMALEGLSLNLGGHQQQRQAGGGMAKGLDHGHELLAQEADLAGDGRIAGIGHVQAGAVATLAGRRRRRAIGRDGRPGRLGATVG